ncbi:N-acetyltransferase [Candidatus Bathyarchaeota archaeon]|jgi:ribosomal-protein-alanine N-acetyltransferase|nr:MAG: N-acetyltransferase [Candidatus Bathyarchaeota archaeon]
MDDFPKIAIGRLLLRGPMDKDLQNIYDIHVDPEVMRYYGVLPYDSLEKARKHLDWLTMLHKDNKGLRWIITLKGIDNYIGDVGFYDYEEKHKRAEIGYILGRDHWGKGIMSEAVEAALRYGFNELGLNRVQALIDPRNQASKRVAEKQGFQYEGTFRDYEREYGEFIDLEMHSLLARDVNR